MTQKAEMTQDEILILARKAGFITGEIFHVDGSGSHLFVHPVGDSCFVEIAKLIDLVIAYCKEPIDTKSKVCYECDKECNYLFGDGRCKNCTRLTPEEVIGD